MAHVIYCFHFFYQIKRWTWVRNSVNSSNSSSKNCCCWLQSIDSNDQSWKQVHWIRKKKKKITIEKLTVNLITATQPSHFLYQLSTLLQFCRCFCCVLDSQSCKNIFVCVMFNDQKYFAKIFSLWCLPYPPATTNWQQQKKTFFCDIISHPFVSMTNCVLLLLARWHQLTIVKQSATFFFC